ncbi:MAG: hypothetical protein WC719_04680 [Patescibacteria group bacterium]|jgi:hypothetical protein
MPNFEHYHAGESKDEAERLYGNDISLKKFSGRPYIADAAELSENTGLYGESDELSAEEKIYDKLDHGVKSDGALLILAKICDDYLNDKTELPADVTEAEARELALIYRDSLTDKKNRADEKEANLSKSFIKHTEVVDLKRGQIAKATPDSNEKVKLDRRSQEQHVARRMEKAL